jgi:hypothetical protein
MGMAGSTLRKIIDRNGAVFTATVPATKFTPGSVNHFATELQRDKFVMNLLRHGDHAVPGTVDAASCLGLLTKEDYLV